MILYDAVFIIEFFLKNIEIVDSKRNQLKNEDDIWSDLLLLENQIPYFVLKYLYDRAFGNYGKYPPFDQLSCMSVVRLTSLKKRALNLEDDEVEFKHFTDLQRFVLTNGYSRPPTTGLTSDLRCAIKLQESGMKFKQIDDDDGVCLLDIKFEKMKRRAPFQWLKVHELKIPKLEVNDQTESVFRNLMALEQCCGISVAKSLH